MKTASQVIRGLLACRGLCRCLALIGFVIGATDCRYGGHRRLLRCSAGPSTRRRRRSCARLGRRTDSGVLGILLIISARVSRSASAGLFNIGGRRDDRVGTCAVVASMDLSSPAVHLVAVLVLSRRCVRWASRGVLEG